ncbi:MAG: S-layer homology domain-containing protein, partial [Chloroflexota bacterium]|nr:S-layer homology domain-containing protein [Chloroflexota bacterium]
PRHRCSLGPTPTVTPGGTATPTAIAASATPAASASPTPAASPTPCGQFNTVPSPNVGSNANYLRAVSALANNDVWAVGAYSTGTVNQTLVEHWNGSAWSVVPSPNVGSNDNNLTGVSALTSNDVWAVGYYYTGAVGQTLVEHWNGSAWTVLASPNPGSSTNILNGVAARASNDVWAVGYDRSGGANQTLVEHWNGSAWAVSASPNVGSVDNGLSAVSALASNDVWAVGGYSNGPLGQTLVEHWDGSAWSVFASPNVSSGTNVLFGVSALANNDVWAVGEYVNGGFVQTLVEHWNGSAWSVFASPNPGSSTNILNGVSAFSSNDVWAVGYYHDNGNSTQTLVEHWNGTVWSVVPSPNSAGGANELYGVSALPSGEVWAVGDYGGPRQTLVEQYGGPCGTPTPTVTPGGCTIRFSDVTDPTAYYYQGVYYLACRGVISGYNDGTYQPFNNTTRAQMTKIVTLAFNIPLVPPPATGTFADVDNTSVFYQLIETAAARTIVSGYTCGGSNPQTGAAEPCDSAGRPYFRPSNSVSRGQLAKIVVIGAGFAVINPPTATFTDVDRQNVFYSFIETAVCHGAISGYSDNTFRPNNYAFRGQIAKIVYLAVTNAPATCAARASTVS